VPRSKPGQEKRFRQILTQKPSHNAINAESKFNFSLEFKEKLSEDFSLMEFPQAKSKLFANRSSIVGPEQPVEEEERAADDI
jgi:methionine-rich copper-binding protein CopC